MTDATLLLTAAPRALLMAMTLSYALCFAGLIFAWISYRRRQRNGGTPPGEHKGGRSDARREGKE